MYRLRETHKAVDTKERHSHTFTDNERHRVHNEEVHPTANTPYSYWDLAFRHLGVAKQWKRKGVIGTDFG